MSEGPVTHVPQARAAIENLLNAAAESDEALKEITVSNAEMPERKRKFVWIWKAKSKRDFRVIGPAVTPQKEDMLTTMMIWAAKGEGRNPRPAEDKAMEIFEAVETALREDVTLEDSVLMHHIETMEIEGALLDQTHGCRIVAIISAQARI